MSDQPPPSKPKPGSLRDRIAAFEKSAGSAAPGPAPVPRPKPGGVSWKPKSPSPPTSPSASDPLLDKKSGGMSASDAKESIKSGGTLKERMAALQNRGGFGAPPPVAPKPPMEKPKWRPPPVVAPVDKDDDDEPSRDVDPAKLIPPVGRSTSEEKSADEKDEDQATSSDQVEGEEAAVADPDGEEQQRRAAIAARMARLGGARVGMAPMFGRPPPVKKPEPVDEATTPTKLETPTEKTTDQDTSQNPEVTPSLSIDEPSTAITSASDEQPTMTSDIDTVEPPSAPVRKNSGPSPSLYTEAEAQATRSPPLSMPVPSAPRRAAPPRRKAPKTPEAPPPAVIDQIVGSPENPLAMREQDILDDAPAISESVTKEHGADVQEEFGEADQVASESEPPASVIAQGVEDVPAFVARDFAVKGDEPEKVSGNVDASKDAVETSADEAETEGIEPSRAISPAHHTPEHPAKPTDEEDVAKVVSEKDLSPQIHNANEEAVAHVKEEHEKQDAEKEHVEARPVDEVKEEEPVAQAAEEVEEDEEDARRKRLAEKLAKMGGVNPFALPPQRQASSSSEDIQTSPTLTKRSSISRSSVTSPPPPPPLPPQRKQSHASVAESLSVVEPTRVQYPESKLVADPPALPQTTREYTVEPVALEKQSIDSEDDTQEINYDAKTAAGLTHTAREGPKTDHEWATDPTPEVDGGLPDKTLSDAKPETPPPLPPPRVPSLTRPIGFPPVDPAVPIDPVSRHQGTTPAVAHPISPLRSLPPPPRLVPEPPESEEELSDSGLPGESSPLSLPSPLSYQPSEDEEEPPRRLPPRPSAPSEEPTNDETPPLPVPNRRSMQSDDFIPPSGKRLSARPSRPIPLPPTVSAPVSDAEDSDLGEVLPTPPRHRPETPAIPPAPPNEIPLIIPPPASDEPVRRVDPSPLRQSSYPEAAVHVPPPSVGSGETSPAFLSPLGPSLHSHGHDQEVLDEEEGDPIDPSFHSPSRRTSFIDAPSANSPPVPEPVVAPEEDEQALRRRTIAERMAKLGGIKFGAAPPSPHVARSPPPVPKEEEAEQENFSEQPSGAHELTEEEEEQARKERIAAKLAMMGGMRIGMMPLGAGAVRSQTSQEEERPPAPPSRAPPARPPPLPQTPDTDEQEGGLSASQYSNATSDEGVKVEVEDSEIEEVSHVDAQETEEEPEEVPPPVPARGPRRRGTANSESEHLSTSPPPPPRPPVPTSFPTRSASIRSASIQSTSSMARQSSSDSTTGGQKPSTYKPQSEYVMVEEPSDFVPEEEIPPPPPARPSHRPPPRTAPLPPPPPPEPSVPISDSISSQWVMPSVPSGSIEFSTLADISLSWPEDLSASSSSQSPPPPPPSKSAVHVDVPLSSDDLMTVWGRVGVQICEVATTLFEKSKKSLIGDGTYDGFIRAVLSEVPNAVMPTSSASYGHLIYAQTGNTVQKRASEILPGDIMVLQDAKLKGHKGLQSYHQNIGIGEPLVGVVSEFELKKSKVRLFQANQHVGQQTVEAVSYRLEDLKSGTVQVFRVLEN